MDRLETMQVFVRVAERMSFAAAARDLGLPASTVTDAVKGLEKRLGVRLLERTTRQVRLTPDGEVYRRRCLALLADFEEAETAFRGAKPKGTLRIDAQGSMARHIILPGLPRFLDEHPGLDVQMSETDRFIDPIAEGVDCVVRAGPVGNTDLVARRVALLPEMTCVAPEYVARFGMPERWDRLDGHRMVGYRSSASGGVLPLEFMVDGEKKTVMLPMVLSVDAAESYREAALRGLGLIQIPRYRNEGDFAGLIEILSETPPSPTPVSLLFARDRLMSPRVRVFLDWLTEEFRNALPGEGTGMTGRAAP
jgi:DNA-binding transcriptional LysR family regulator